MAPSIYAGLPDTVLGIKCTSHKKYKVEKVLSYYKLEFKKSAKKPELLKVLLSLSGKVTERERLAIRGWLNNHKGTLGQLATTITDAREDIQSITESKESPEENSMESETRKFDSNGRACAICLDKLADEAFPDESFIAPCNHLSSTCKSCLKAYIDGFVKEHRWIGVKCPECESSLTDENVEKHASKESYERYTRNSAAASMRHLTNFALCIADCGSGQIHQGGHQNPKMVCTACGFMSCFTHNLPWHEDQSCKEYDITHELQIEQEGKSTKYLTENTKKCPGPGCGIHVVKEGRACDHITCSQCLFDFCWNCRVPYDLVRHIGGTAHEKTCHLWKEETPTQWKERKATERRDSKKRKMGTAFGEHAESDPEE